MDATNNVITFREIVKLIHPDLNPGITDVGSKMVEIKNNRNNGNVLYNLGVTWGVIKIEKQKVKTQNTNNVENQVEEERARKRYRTRNHIFYLGDVVLVTTRRIRVVITRITYHRVYFNYRGKQSWAKKENVVII